MTEPDAPISEAACPNHGPHPMTVDCPECCSECGGMMLVELPELLPCPKCDPVHYLAERVLCDLPHDDMARRVAREIRGYEVLEADHH